MSTDRPQDREATRAFRDDEQTLPSPVIRGAAGRALSPGRVLDERYTLVERIGAGGWGEVWRAVQNSTRREVALKILRADVASGEGARERFQLEAEAVSCLVHQNTVTLFDYGRTPDGETYMAMELLDGDTLDQVLAQEGPMDPARALAVVRQVALSLDEAHGKGIIHRDVKPHNIMLLQRPGEPDFVKVLDFGVAKWVLEDHQLTTTGTTFGTPEYMSPEQVQSKRMDHRTDLYSLGVILYTLLAAAPPFRGESAITVALQHINKRLPPLPRERSVPKDVESLVRSLTDKDPARRPFSAAEVAERCDDLLRNPDSGAAVPLRRWAPWLAVLAGLLLGTGVFALWQPWEGSGESAGEGSGEGSVERRPPSVASADTSQASTSIVRDVVDGSSAEVRPPSVAFGDTSPGEGGGVQREAMDVAVEILTVQDVEAGTVDGGAEVRRDVVSESPDSAPPAADIGAEAPPAEEQMAVINVTSRAAGAVAHLHDGTRCPCPCRVERPVGTRLKLTVRAPGHEERRLTLRFRGGRKTVPSRLAPIPLSERDGLKGDLPPSATDGLK